MADLNPLAFKVEIQDEATLQLNKIEQEFKKLQDKTISVKVEGVQDLRNLLNLLQHQQVSELGKDVGKEISKAAQNLQKEAQDAVRNSLGELAKDLVAIKTAIQHDNFTAFSKRIETCAEKVNMLDEAFKKFHVTIGADSGMRNFMTGLGEVIRNVRTTMGSIEAGKNGGISSLANTYARNVERIEDAMRRIRETRLILGDKLSAAGGAGISVDNRQIYMLDAYMKKLEAIRSDEQMMHGIGWQTETFGNSYKTLLSGAESYMKYLDGQIQKQSVIETNQQRYNKLLADAEKLLQRIDSAGAQGNKLGLDTTLSRVGARDVSNFIEKALNIKDVGNSHEVSELISQFQRLKTVYGEIAREQERLNGNTVKAGERADAQYMKEVEQFTKQSIQEYNRWQESIRQAGVEVANLKIKIKELEEVRRSGQKAGVGTSQLVKLLPQLRQSLSILEEIHNGERKYGTAKEYIRGEEYQTRITLAKQEAAAITEGVKAKAKAAAEQEKADNEAIRRLQTIETSQRRYNNALDEMQRLLARLSNADTAGQKLGLNTDKTWDAYLKLKQHIDKVLNFDTRNFGDKHAVGELIGEWNAFKRVLSEVAREQEKFNKEERKEQKNDRAEKNKELEKWAESYRKAGVEATKLELQIRKLKEIEAKGAAVGVDTTQLRQNIATLESYLSTLRQIAGGSTNFGHTSDVLKQVTFQDASARAKDEAQSVAKSTAEIEKNNAAKQKAAAAANQLSAEEQRLAQALNQTTESARGQSQVMADLKSMATQYLGVWGGQQFLHNIIEIGGQLEMQRLSIGAILQNTAQANELFDKIKGLATQSPFGVVQLDQMTKQLTAYGFKYNELYDMTKRLADISAATGTDVSRLALALGHVRSEAALSGYTLRQFSMANVPLLQKLSEKLGKTTKEIREMTKKKEIGYDDVVGVLKDLTNEGGMFYNMQEVISESVKAKFKNVKDAMDIMYGEMAEGAIGDALKEVANALMEVTKNWKDAATVLGTGAAIWGVQRAAMLIYTKTLGTSTATLWSNIRAHQVATAENNLFALSYRKLTAAEKEQIVVGTHNIAGQLRRRLVAKLLNVEREKAIAISRKEIIAATALQLSEKKVTVETIARSVAMGKLSKVEAALIIKNSTLSASEKALAMQTIKNVRTFGAFSGVVNGAAMAASRLGMALKGLLLNPMTLIMAGITAVMELWQRNSREMEAAEELSKKIYEHSQESLKNTRSMMDSTGISVKWRKDKNEDWSDVTGNYGGQIGGMQQFVLPKFDTSAAQESIEQWSQYIRDYAATPNRILNEALFDSEGKVRSLKDQFDNLKNAVTKVAEAQRLMQNFGDAFENAVNATDGGWFDDNVTTDISDYDKKVKKFGANVTATYRKYRQAVDNGVKAAQRQDQAFADATKGMDTYVQKFKYLAEHTSEYSQAWAAFQSGSGFEGIKQKNALEEVGSSSAFRTGFDEVEEAKAEMQNELNDFFVSLEGELELRGIDKKKIQESEAIQQALLLSYKDKLSSIQGLSEETANELLRLFAQHFGITLDVDDEKFRVKESEVQRILKELSESEWDVNINFASNINDVIAEARKQYKAAKEFYENAEPVLVKFGVKMKMGDVLTEAQIQDALAKAPENARDFLEQVLRGANEASRLFNQATTASNNGGFSLDPKEDKKKEKEKNKNKTQKAYKDEFAKRWDERIRIMKEAYDWYDKWEKKVGNDAAIAETNSKYADIFREWKTDKLLPMDFDVNEIADYTKYVEKIRDDALKRYQAQKNDKGKNNGQEALRVYRQAVALLNEVKFDNFTKAAEQFKSNLNKAMDDLLRKWEIFNSVREATGDSKIAAHILGMDEGEVSQRNTANATKAAIENSLAAMNDEIKVPVKFDINMSDKQIEDNVKEALGGTKYQDRIDSIVEALKKWRELQRNVIKDDIQNYAKLIGSAVDYESQVKKIDDELEKAKEANANLVKEGVISQADADKADDIATAQTEDKKWKLSLQYVTLMNSSLAMTRKQVEQGVNVAMQHLQNLLDHNLITAKEFAEEMEKLRGIKADWDKNALFGKNNELTNFLKGGLGGLEQYYKGHIKHADEVLADSGATNIQKRQATEEKATNEKSLERLQNFQNKLSGVALVSEMVMGAFDGLQQATQSLSEMFDALGNEGAANLWSDVSDTIGGISSIFAPVNNLLQSAMSGNVAGMVTSAITAPVSMITGPITAFSKLHDKKLERAINKLREDVQRIENNTKLIVAARERTLGFDTGDVRRSYAQQYAPNEQLKKLFENSWFRRTTFGQGFTSKAQKDMYEYYSKNSSGTGYQQEYQNLLQQRQDYMEILNEQESKKKKSQSDIEETKAKIAELDDQIRYFTQDLAKELFDIDVKGWADQLSDALASAFENGEDMAKAYKETVTSILQQVMNKMMQMAIIEPMFQSLQDKLFGNAEKNISGVFDPADPQGSMAKVTAMITDFFGKGGEGEKTITAAQEFMTAFQRGVQNAGLSVLNDSANTLSSSVQGTSEETSDLFAAYLNACRQDVAINRILLTQFVTMLWPEYIEQISTIVGSVRSIDSNVLAIRNLLSENGALYEQIASLRNRIDNVVNGIERFNVK